MKLNKQNKQMKKNIFYFLPLIALASCTSSDLTGEQREPVVVGDQEIVLSSGVGELPAVNAPNSRAVINSTLPSAGLDVSIIRLDETGDPKAFPAWSTVTTAADVLSAHVDATNAQVAFNDGATPSPAANPQYYQANGNQTRLQGFYPKDGAVASGVITWTIDGAKDIMVSNYADGDKTAKFGSSKKLTFEHLLTQIVVKAYATEKAALDDVWGGIDYIALKDQNLTCKYTLADGATVGSAAFSGKTGSSHLNIITKKTDDSALSPDYDATNGLLYDYSNDKTKATTCGYAMFEPAAANGLTLIIATKSGGTIEKTLAQQLEKGYAYNVILKFTSTEIVPEVAIAAWKTGTDIEVEM